MTTTETYIPQHLSRWVLPSDYSGAHWDGYYVAPVSRNRDSDILTESNWKAQWADLEPLRADVDCDDIQSPKIVLESHWAVGWVEWVAIHESNAEALRVADELAASLESYPVLDEESHSRMEWEEYVDSFVTYGRRDFIRSLSRKFQLSDSTCSVLNDVDEDKAMDFFQSLIPSGEYFTHYSDGLSIRCDTAARNCTRDALARFLRSIR
jgi:hypothetical protein